MWEILVREQLSTSRKTFEFNGKSVARETSVKIVFHFFSTKTVENFHG
jgi:hypothetical protein